ncbi:MAG TPA: dihydroorotase [Desulfobacterales bacterium]|nr:dihydroorotase [Desulfobacterales bacterium]HUW72189.1 dihydroorotase [Candidatus Humimicrobiaceae bacterium]
MSDKLVLRRFDDMHCHFRIGPIMTDVVPFTARYAGRATVMPNTRPRAILTGADVIWYRDHLRRLLDGMELAGTSTLEPLMTIEIRDNTTPEMIIEAKHVGAIAGKVYPLGVTTNSDEGLRDFFNRSISKTFRAMQDVGMILLLHGEIDQERTLVTKREEAFLPILVQLAEKFPDLKIVLEHVSTKEAVRKVKELGKNIAATITAHHLCLTLNDVIGYGIQPHNAYYPIAKGFEDRDVLIETATSGDQKFFLGSDTAPHPRGKKECARGACGIFTAPVLPSVLAEIFEKAGRLDRLEDFTSRFGAEFYGLPLNEDSIILVRNEWRVPEQIGDIVPFRAGTRLDWQLSGK